MIVHSSFINPWFAPFFGTLVLAIGQLFTVKLFAVLSNAGLLVYTITLILLMKQIDRDIVSFSEFTDFLQQVAKKGNEINVHNVISSDPNGQGTKEVKVSGQSIMIGQSTRLPNLDEDGVV